MSTDPAQQSEVKLAAEVCQHLDLSEDARKLLFDEQTAPQFLALLIKNGLHQDALRFVAYDLPKRKAIWWGCLCLWETYRPSPPKDVDAALDAVVQWVQNPEEAQRREADAAGKVVGGNTPIGMLAQAAFCSGGSISLPDCPEVLPDEWLTAQLVAAAVVLASKSAPPAKRDALQRKFLVLAGEVTACRLAWHPDDAQIEAPAPAQ